MTTLRQFVNVPCATCQCDRLHIANVCHYCGASLTLTPRQPGDFDPGLSRKAKAAAMALAKARTAKLNSQPRCMSERAVYMRAWRVRQRGAKPAQMEGREGV